MSEVREDVQQVVELIAEGVREPHDMEALKDAMRDKSPRGIRHIAIAAGDTADWLYAICNDGTVWSSYLGARPLEWKSVPLPPIPQEVQA